ncbi:hypothetical protein ACR9E3_19055 [Actinomycetospora sp. C-140]
MADTSDRTQVSAPVDAALAALAECGRVSTACAGSMIEIGGMAEEVRHALDCADLCGAAERVLARHGALDDPAVSAAIDAATTACRESAQACGAHADHHPHCATHSRSATACVEALQGARGA